MTKSRPAISAWENDRTIVRFPDPAVEVVDERFRSLVVWQEVVERLWRSRRYLVSSGRTATQSISTRILIKPAWIVVRTGRFSSKNSLYTSLYSAKRVGSVR
jgi:hypothetical protein